MGVTPTTIGNVLVIGLVVRNFGPPSPPTPSGGGVTAWVKAQDASVTDSGSGNVIYTAVWYGTVTTTGAATVTFSTSIGAATCQEFAGTATGEWQTDGAGAVLSSDTAAPTWNFGAPTTSQGDVLAFGSGGFWPSSNFSTINQSNVAYTLVGTGAQALAPVIFDPTYSNTVGTNTISISTAGVNANYFVSLVVLLFIGPYVGAGSVTGNFSAALTETETAPTSGTLAATFSAIYPDGPIEVLPAGTIAAAFDATINTNAGFAPTNTVPWMLPVAINDHPYVMDFIKSRITTMQVRRQASDNSVEPGEQTLSIAGVWPRAQDNYFLGAGQEFMDNRFAFESVYVHSGEYPSVRTRFWKSQGVSPWTEGKMTLLGDYSGVASSTLNLLIVVCGNYLYRTDGPYLYFTQNPTLTTTPTWTAVTKPGSQNIVSLTTDGSRVWMACANDGVYVTEAGTTTVTPAATPAQLPNVGGLLVYGAGAGTVNATNLPNSATTWSVTKVDAFGNQTAATSATATPASTPMNINWQPDTNASSYNVYRGSNLVYQGTDPSFVDDGSIAGTPSTVPSTNGTGASAYAATFVLYAKGHLIASTGRDLVEILASGNISFIYQHENPGFAWTCGTECPTAILVGGYAGGTSFVGAIQPDAATNGATLAPPTWATTMTPGEQINAISYDAGAILMGTNLGIRSGTKPDSLGTFDVNPVIEDMGPVQCVASWSQYEYFGWSNYDPSEPWATRPTVSGLGRADLSQYTTPGVPAYATDVMGATGGTTTQCLVVLGTPFFVVNNAGTYTLYWPNGLVVAEGWFEPGWIRYGTLENKIVVEVDFQHEPLPAGASIDYKIVSENMTNVTDVGSNSLAGSTTLDEPFNAGLMVGDRFMPIITLTAPSARNVGPVFHSHITKAMVTTKRQDEVLLALVWSDEAQTLGPSGRTWWLDLYLEYVYLKGLEQLGETVNLTMGGLVKVAYIDQIMLEPTDMSADRQFFQGTLTVKLVTLS